MEFFHGPDHLDPPELRPTSGAMKTTMEQEDEDDGVRGYEIFRGAR
jgi:hypothetical protein